MQQRPGCLPVLALILCLICCACAGQPSETTAPTETAANTVTVTFQPHNGDALTVFTLEKGAAAPEAPSPQKRACVFAGWYVGEAKWDPSAPVEADVTVEARWTLAEDAFAPDPNAGIRADGTDLRVCTFNTLSPSVGSMVPVSPDRDAAVKELLNVYGPDIIALQEQGENWFNALTDVFSGTDYKLITGKYPSFGGGSSMNNMVYNSAVLELLDANLYEYIVGRNMVWAVFETKDEAKQQLIVVSTHWTTIEDDNGRVLQAREMLKQIGKLKETYPSALVIAMGDFNSWDSYGSYQTVLTEGNMTDAKYAAQKRGLASATTHASTKTKSFTEEKINTAECIDHIFLSEGIEPLYYDTIIDERVFVASDHCAIYADIQFKS